MLSLMSNGISSTVFHTLERNMGRTILVVLDRDFGFESVTATVSQKSSGTWLSDAQVVELRAALANPLLHMVSRGNRSEFFYQLESHTNNRSSTLAYTRILGDCLKLISVKIPETQVEGLDVLIRARMYQSRSADIREAV